MIPFIDIVRHFGYQMKEGLDFSSFQEDCAKDKVAFAQVEPNKINWYIPSDKKDHFLGIYTQTPLFEAEPQSFESKIEGYDLYVFPFVPTDYIHYMQVIAFLQSGTVQGFYIADKYYRYPTVIAEKNFQSPNHVENLESEIKTFRSAIDRTFADALLQNYLGKLYVEYNDANMASKHFVNACQIEPYFAEPFSNMGALLWSSGEKEKGFTLFSEAIVRNPFDMTLQDNFIQSGLELGQIEAMNESLDKIQQFYPDYDGLQYVKALLLEKLGRKSEALTLLNDLKNKGVEDSRIDELIVELKGE